MSTELLTVLHLCIAPMLVMLNLSIYQKFNQTSIRIMWKEVDCVQRNGRIIEYVVIISNAIVTHTT